ncbi:MAG: N-acetyltransferase [Butyrivibrio sp.]|nr:N-acetyltransferase [Butyrivibrio sp.]
MDIYEECPVLENGGYIVRLIEQGDAGDLFNVYNDKFALPFFNGDNCNGSNFYCARQEDAENTVKYWLIEYRENRGFVRFATVDKTEERAVGTIEMFRRESDDSYNGSGILRLDLKSSHERSEVIYDILSLVTEPFYDWFGCADIATKAAPYAVERIDALKSLGFVKSDEPLISRGENRAYYDYWVLKK